MDNNNNNNNNNKINDSLYNQQFTLFDKNNLIDNALSKYFF